MGENSPNLVTLIVKARLNVRNFDQTFFSCVPLMDLIGATFDKENEQTIFPPRSDLFV
jgi:hypothetical protein